MEPLETGLLPGMESPTPVHVVGPVESETIAALTALRKDGLITGKYIAIAATLETTARAVDRGMIGGPKGVSVATANLAKLLVETLDALPEPLTGQEPYFDALDAQIQALTAKALA